MIIVATGFSPDEYAKLTKPFACSLNFSGAAGNPEEALSLLIKRKSLYRDWIKTISFIHQDKVIEYWIEGRNWTN